MYLAEVIWGLEQGESFKHPLAGGGEERLVSLNDDLTFEHIVDGEAATLQITVLLNGRWPTEGWERI